MGNRAVITTAPYSSSNVGIYVHWNGGRASILGFLAACKELGMRSPGTDNSYAIASLAQVIGLHFGLSGMSCGIDTCDKLDTSNGDNGVYLIGGDWQIVGRKFDDGLTRTGRNKRKPHECDILPFDEIDEEKSKAMCESIVEKAKAVRAIEARESASGSFI